MLCTSVGPRPDGDVEKDTLSNVEETGVFVVNIVSLYLSNTMHESSKNHPPEADEFEKAGLTPAACEVVIGRMVRFHVRDELYGENGRIDVSSLDPLGRLAGNYTKVETIFELPADQL